MEDKTLASVCLVISIIGIATLMILTSATSVETKDKISKDDIDKIITIEGKISSVKETKATYKLVVNNIKVTVFKTKPLQLKKGIGVQITGKVQEYNNQLELLADKILTL